jgi:hypothetical protein
MLVERGLPVFAATVTVETPGPLPLVVDSETQADESCADQPHPEGADTLTCAAPPAASNDRDVGVTLNVHVGVGAGVVPPPPVELDRKFATVPAVPFNADALFCVLEPVGRLA